MSNKIILQKYIAENSEYSRRGAQELIRDGKVFVNDKLAELGMRVDEFDVVKVDGKILKKQSEKIYIALNKPVGYTCTNRKFKGEKNVFELVDVKEKLFTVGRLDKNSHGLVILTNDGDWANEMSHPRYNHEKIYEVRVEAKNKKLRRAGATPYKELLKGVDIGEGDGAVRAKAVTVLGDDLFEIVLTEGKKRQIRRMFKVLGYEVVDLKRVAFGEFILGDLESGKWRRLMRDHSHD